MPPEPNQIAEFLLERARENLGAARILIAEEQAKSVIGFQLEQAVEASLRSILARREGEAVEPFNLGVVLKRVAGLDLEIPAAVASADWLGPWAVDFRYEEETTDLNIDAALEAATAAVGLAEHVLDEDDTDPAA
jgi:HEPN domain-containing protein